MAKLYNLARMTTATTGTGTVTLGAASPPGISFASAGVQNGDTVTYAIREGDDSEIGRGVYSSTGPTLTRTVLKSTNGNSLLNLGGSAEVFITLAAEDLNDNADARYVRFDGAQSLSQSQRQQARENLDLDDAPLVFDTLTLAKAESIDTSINTFETRGFRTIGDNGDGVYKRLGSTPSPTYAWHAQSADGAWWVLVSDEPRPEQFGAYGDDTTHPLSGTFGTLAAAQALFPWATALTNEWDWCALYASWRYLPLDGGKVMLSKRYLIHDYLPVGDGTSTSASTYQNIEFIGDASGVQRNLVIAPSTPPTNRTSIRLNSASVIAAVIWVLGPISCSFADFTIDVNNKADRGIYLVHNMNYNVSRVTVENYRASAFELSAYENADTAAGVYNTHGDGIYDRCIVAAPQLTSSCAFTVGNGSYAGTGILDVSRITFKDCQLTVGDSSSGAGFVLRFCDNIKMEGCFIYSQTGACTPFLISPPTGFISYPQVIIANACVTYGNQTWPAQAAWTPGRRGFRYIHHHAENIDRVGLPIDIYNRVSGINQDGTAFGIGSSTFYSTSTSLTSAVNTTTETTIASHVLDAFALAKSRSAVIRTRGFFRNGSGSNADITIKAKVAFSGPTTAVSSNTTASTSALGQLYAVNSGSAVTVTIPTSGFSRNFILWVENQGAGTCTVSHSGGTTFTVATGAATRGTYDGSAWTWTTVTVRATISDTSTLTQASATTPNFGYRSCMIEEHIYGRNSETSEAAHMLVDIANSPNLNTAPLSAVTRYQHITDALTLDTRAPYTLTITFQWSVANSACDAYVVHSSLELY